MRDFRYRLMRKLSWMRTQDVLGDRFSLPVQCALQQRPDTDSERRRDGASEAGEMLNLVIWHMCVSIWMPLPLSLALSLPPPWCAQRHSLNALLAVRGSSGLASQVEQRGLHPLANDDNAPRCILAGCRCIFSCSCSCIFGSCLLVLHFDLFQRSSIPTTEPQPILKSGNADAEFLYL